MIEVNKEYLQSLQQRISTLSDKMHIEQSEIELGELKIRQADPKLWENQTEANKLMQQIGSLENHIKSFRNAESEITDLSVLFEMGENSEILSSTAENIEKLLEDLEFYFALSDPDDKLDCIIKITAGAGGTEAQDWTQMLVRMYTMYCTAKFGKPTVVYVQEGSDKIGLKTCSLRIEGEYAYGFLKNETGVHRLVRVSPYNAQGKRMTSFASVFVSPVIDDSIVIELDESKLTFDYFRSSGAGGQNVNKVNSGVRARYMYTDPDTGVTEEILVENTETRDQPKNKERAKNILKSILYKKEMDKKRAKQKEIEDSKGDNGWGNQIRSYVLDDSRVKDHRTEYTEHSPESVLNGNIEGFIKAEISY